MTEELQENQFMKCVWKKSGNIYKFLMWICGMGAIAFAGILGTFFAILKIIEVGGMVGGLLVAAVLLIAPILSSIIICKIKMKLPESVTTAFVGWYAITWFIFILWGISVILKHFITTA